jgi:hypothetical protein
MSHGITPTVTPPPDPLRAEKQRAISERHMYGQSLTAKKHPKAKAVASSQRRLGGKLVK